MLLTYSLVTMRIQFANTLSRLIRDPLTAMCCPWMDVISVDIIPSRNRLHPILSCDNAMCLNLGGASIIASSIVIAPRRWTYFTILSVRSGSVSAASSHCSSAVVPSWNASTRPASGHSCPECLAAAQEIWRKHVWIELQEGDCLHHSQKFNFRVRDTAQDVTLST